MPSKQDLADIWNKHNNVDSTLHNLTTTIRVSQDEIKRIKKLFPNYKNWSE